MLRGPIRFTNVLGGTADFIYPGPAIDMQSPAAAGAVNGATYVYYAQSLDMTEWETGSGAYTSSSGTFARTTVAANSLGTTAKIDFANPPQIVVFDTATAFVTAADVAVAAPVGQCKLVFNSATQLTLIPWDGNKLRINGVLYPVQDAGVSISNGGLAASTLYYVYAYMNAGVMTLEFSTTAYVRSNTAPNNGVAVKSTDVSRTLVGMVYTNTSSQFQDDAQNRYMRSWFNEGGIAFYNFNTTSVGTPTTSWVELDATIRTFMLTWYGEQVTMTIASMATNNTVGAVSYTGYFVDGVFNGLYAFAHFPSAGYYGEAVIPFSTAFLEGRHSISLAGQVSAGTGTWANKYIAGSTIRH